jgi:membrane protease YdiL (CAAX protease family)
MSEPARVPGALRAIWLLTRLRLRRLANLLSARPRREANKGQPGAALKKRPAWAERFAKLFPALHRRGTAAKEKRTGTPLKKRRYGWAVSAFVILMMSFVYGNLARQSIVSMHNFLDHPHRRMGILLPSGVLSEALLRGVAMELSLLMVAAVFGTLATRELSHSDWDLEWLVTLPVRSLNLQIARVIERSVVNPYALMMFVPMGALVAWISGYRVSALPVGILTVLPMLALTAMARTLIDTGLRLSLSPARLRNLSALLSIVSLLLLYSFIGLGLPRPPAFILAWARSFPLWATWLPPGLIIRALNGAEWVDKLRAYGLLVGEALALLVAGFAILNWQLRNGVVNTGARETGRRTKVVHRDIDASEGRIGSVVQRRELRLLSRDRSFLVQTLVLPVILVCSQVVFQGRLHGASLAGAANTTIASIAFALAAYTLMMSAFQTLNTEGGALWLLFTVPKSLSSVLAEKAKLWAVLALGYPLLVFVLTAILRGQVDAEYLALAAVVMFGVPIYSGIAVALGVFGSDPLSQDVRTKVKPTYVYMYMLLSAIYTYAIFASEWWQKLVLMLLSGLLALALWQKARDELPFLLDPAASPPPRIATSDGVIAAMLFFVIQGIVAAVQVSIAGSLDDISITMAYSVAGGFTFLMFRYVYWRSNTEGVPRVFGAGFIKAIPVGLGAGVVAAAAGVGYLYFLRRFGVEAEQIERSTTALAHSAWLPVMAVAVAPICEEFIFRGLIFSGLRRSLGLFASVLGSAAVFAVVHPPLSMIPVFFLGVCAALAYQRSKLLLAPMLAHALYNATVIFVQIHW